MLLLKNKGTFDVPAVSQASNNNIQHVLPYLQNQNYVSPNNKHVRIFCTILKYYYFKKEVKNILREN